MPTIRRPTEHLHPIHPPPHILIMPYPACAPACFEAAPAGQ